MRLLDHKMQGPRCGENSATWHRTEPIPPVLRAPLRRSYLQDARKPERRSDLSRVTQEGSPERVLAAVLPRCPEWLCCCCLVAQLCLTLCDPRDCSPPGSSVHGIVQARILEWVTISFSRDLPTKRSNPRLQHWQADSFHCATWEAWALLSYLFSVAENWDTDWRLIANVCLCITQVTVKWSVSRLCVVKKSAVGVVCFCSHVILSFHLS